MKNFMMLCLALLMSLSLMAQQRRITGTVTDIRDNSAMIGVTVLEKGTNNGTVTDIEGNFSINVISDNPVLSLSSIGYRTIEINVGSESHLIIQMKEDTELLDELVVVGYGTMRKSDLTGSVSSISGSELSDRSAGSFETLLQGKVAGLQVFNSSNDNPQGGATVRVRGVSSINASNAPLVVVDGIPIADAGGINSINPTTIESIEVLKDASATAIFGSRGANGVIMVTTKKGTGEKPNVWVNHKTSIGLFSEKLDYWRDPVQMIRLDNESRENAGLDPIYIGQRDPSGTYYPFLADVESGAWPYHTHWEDYIFRDASITTDTNIGVQGSNGKSNNYYISLGYYTGQGMQKRDDYDKFSLDLSYMNKLSEILTVHTKSGFFTGIRNTNYGLDYTRNPLFPVYSGDGSYYKMNQQDYGNPVALTNERVSNTPNTDGFATLQFDLDITKELQLVVRGNGRAGTSTYNFYNPRVYTQGGDYYNGEGGINTSSYSNLTFDGYMTYSKIFDSVHNFSAMAGVTYESSRSKGVNTTGRDFSNDILKEENLAGAGERFITNYLTESVLASGFTRLNYVYKDRYLATFTARADGSSKFGDNNKWGYFPSGALSWRLSEEEFIRELDFFDHLKIRASYGVSGNQGIAPYQTMSQFGQDYYYLNGDEYIIYGVGQQIGREGIGDRFVTWGGMANKDLRWEKTSQLDVGLDMTIIDNRLNLTFDFYEKRTEDLLRQQFLNPSTGFDKVWTNDGEIENKGIELALDAHILTTGKWKLDAGLVFSRNRNKVLGIGSQNESGYIVDKNGIRYEPYGSGVMNDAFLNVLAIGYPINSFYGYKVDGIIQEMQSDPVKMTRPGEFNYIGLLEDGTLDPDQRTIIGDPNPDFTSSFHVSLRHQSGFDLSFMAYLMYGNDIYSTRKLSKISLQQDRWTPENPTNERPSLRADRQYFASSWFVEDGSFLRIQNITLGYSLSKLKFIQDARVYFNATNPITFYKTSEFDPEVGENGRGLSSYPRVASFTAGIELKF
jgi:TonB-linked SusC/RagA family outer membrane protein